MDARLTAANGRVAHLSLQGQVKAERFVAGEWAVVAVPLADVLGAPGGKRVRQALYGERMLVLERLNGWAFAQAERDGYMGYVEQAALVADSAATHWVCSPATHLYHHPDIKLGEFAQLTLGARLTIVGNADGPVAGRFVKTDQGLFAIAQHLRPIGDWADDPAGVAGLFLGTPYLWGGNSRSGIDCSGLVQTAHLACGIACPGDSDLQCAGLGVALPPDVPARRGDLLFWNGHVALVSGPDRIIHAAGHLMAVVEEGLAEACARIEAQGAGPVLAHKRVAMAQRR